ncbi:MAG: GNAT family N-acetyltransferase [Stappiaceae bacterium]
MMRMEHMAQFQITPLANATQRTATQIHDVMIAAYRTEREILGISEFPPLNRTIEGVARAKSAFIGALLRGQLVAVAEYVCEPGEDVDICALVVLPSHFRMGLGTALLRSIIETHPGARIMVQTGESNRLAVSLYEKLGFRISRTWTADRALRMVELVLIS